jgi:hypothetical protein
VNSDKLFKFAKGTIAEQTFNVMGLLELLDAQPQKLDFIRHGRIANNKLFSFY